MANDEGGIRSHEEDVARVTRLDSQVFGGIDRASDGDTADPGGSEALPGNDAGMDSGSAEYADLGTAPARKPRKPRSDTGKPRQTKARKADLALIEKKILAYHQIGAMIAGVPEIALDEKEASFLAPDILAVLDQYEIDIDPRLQAWINLFITASAIYTPHYLVYLARVRAERQMADAATKQTAPQQVAAHEGMPLN